MVLVMLTLPMWLSTLGRGLAMVQAIPAMEIFSVDEKSPLTSDMKKPANRANLVRGHLCEKMWTFCQ